MFNYFQRKLVYLKNPNLITPALFYKLGLYKILYKDLFKILLNCEGLISPLDAICLQRVVLRNKKKEGDILDFGSHKGLSTCVLSQVAVKIGKKIIAFESFRGLPPPTLYDEDYFKEGDYRASKEEFINNVNKWGRPENIKLIEGEATKTLKEEVKTKRISNFSVAFIDIDLYVAAREILFILSSIARGGEIICLHDIHAPGIQRAIREFRESYKKVSIRNEFTPSITELIIEGKNSTSANFYA
jgi:hypothetical protein